MLTPEQKPEIVYCGIGDDCNNEATSFIERSYCPICDSCRAIYIAGQSNPGGGFGPIGEIDAK